MNRCALCPRNCAAARSAGSRGFCGAGSLPRLALVSLHHWEEPCISGTRGSGTVFFTGCNMRCVFCQNFRISWEGLGREVTVEDLALVFLEQQSRGAHNVNLVSPTPYSPMIADAIRGARRQGLSVPIVYNCNGYETVSSLAALDGLVDVYLPDLKYASDEAAVRYSNAPGYFGAASRAIREMARQVGRLELGSDGIARRGLLVRHLVLPGQAEQARAVLDWIAISLPPGTSVSIMSQYAPMFRASGFPELARTVQPGEYRSVVRHARRIGLVNGYVQRMDPARGSFVPDFDLSGVPGAPVRGGSEGEGG